MKTKKAIGFLYKAFAFPLKLLALCKKAFAFPLKSIVFPLKEKRHFCSSSCKLSIFFASKNS